MSIITKISLKLMKLRLQPIRVFCMHHVSDVYEPSYMWECDWVNTDTLKQWIKGMQRSGYQFIALEEAHRHLANDYIRCHKYAVLTADDGYRSMFNIIPWLNEQQIPITLFVNPRYILEEAIGPNVLDKLACSNSTSTSDAIYFKINDIHQLQSPFVTIAHHGYEHLDSFKLDTDSFAANIKQCIESMSEITPNTIPYYAYPHGNAKQDFDAIVRNMGLTPVYVYGKKNYNHSEGIDREVLSSERIIKGLV